MADPILKWAGGKRAMLDAIMAQFPPKSEFNRYFEPFFGGGAVFFSVEPDNGVINDINPRLMNFYKQIKHSPEQVLAQNEEFDKKYKSKNEEDKKKFYYNLRDEFNELRAGKDECENPLREASLFLCLNRTCWNGLYRTNEDGEFNVPMGSKWTEISVLEQRIREGHRILQNTTIKCGDFLFVAELAEEGDLVFFDPPYPSVRETGSFEKYHPDGFSYERQKELQELAIELDSRGVYVIITNGNDRQQEMEKDRYVADLFAEESLPDSFHTIDEEGKRMINSDSTKRTNIGATDIIVSNFSPFNLQRTFKDFR